MVNASHVLQAAFRCIKVVTIQQYSKLFCIAKSFNFLACFSITSTLFSLILLQRFGRQPLLDKVRIFGTSGWRKSLLEAVPADNLPLQWGGTQEEGRPVCMGGPVPLFYQSVQKPLEIPGMQDITRVTLPRFCTALHY